MDYSEEIIQLVRDKAGRLVRRFEIVGSRGKVGCRSVLFVFP